MYVACLAFLVLSGMAALVYQVTWVRLLGLSMGATTASVGTVLAAFFLGMSLGSVLARRILRPRLAALAPYLALEALIGLAGLALLPTLLHLDRLMAAVPVLGGSLAFKFVVAMALLVVPCVCIGATFPVMAAVLIRRRNEIGLRLGQLYSVNTLGAVLGAGLSGFVLIPAFGLDGTVYVAAGANFLIVLAGLALMRRTALGAPYGDPPAGEAPRAGTGAPTGTSGNGWALGVLFLTGFASIAAEVGYTKYAAIFAGTTIYGFSAILSVFLVGITLGAWLVRRRIDRIGRPHLWVAWGLVLLGAALALTRSGLNLLPGLTERLADAALPAAAVWPARYAALFALLVVPTALFGALFPLNLKLYCGDLPGVAARTGRGYAVNTLGGILGSILAGFVIIPWLGTDVLLLGTAALMVAAALPLLRTASGASRGALAATMAAAVAALVLLPPLDFKPMISAKGGSGARRTYSFLKEGRTSVVTLSTDDGVNTDLANNGLKESAILTADPRHGAVMSVLLGAVPYLLQEAAPRRAFQVGFGGGVTTHALLSTDLASIHVVELEPVVVEAVRHLHGGPVPALEDPRVRLDIDDARHRLLLEPDTYDLIISQPSHPWVAGAANVFTREFYALAASRLNPGGIAAQWVNLFHMDARTLGSIVDAFYAVFPHGAVFGHVTDGEGSLLMVGSDRPLSFDRERTARRLKAVSDGQIPDVVPGPDDLFRYYFLSRDEALALGAGAPPNTDTNILSEVRLARLDRTPTGAEDPYRAVVAHAGYDVTRYLGAPKDQALYRLGDHFIGVGEIGMARRVEQRLEGLSPAVARWLRHKRLVDTYEWAAASALYARHDDWPDTANFGQARVFMESGRFDEARAAAARIRHPVARRAAEVRLLFHEGRWDDLARFAAESPVERAWQLVGAFHRDPDAAAPELLALATRFPSIVELPQLRLLAAYQHRHPDFGAGTYDADAALIRARTTEGRHLAALARGARADGRPGYARALLDRFDRVVDPASPYGREVHRDILGGGG